MPVAPYAGAWIEIYNHSKTCYSRSVAPYAGAWIEIVLVCVNYAAMRSLPTRERGLKYTRAACYADFQLSLPTRERGLKSIISITASAA